MSRGEEYLESIIEGIQNLEITEIDQIQKSLEDQGHLVTKSLLKRIVSVMSIHRCLCCPQSFESRKELRTHMKKNKHYYGQERLADDKREFMVRVEKGKPGSISGLNVNKLNYGEELSKAEIRAYVRLYKYINTLRPHLKSTLERLIAHDVCLIRLDLD